MSPETADPPEPTPPEEPQPLQTPTPIRVPYKEIVNLYNTICTSLPKVIEISEARQKTIKVRYMQVGCSVDEMTAVFHRVEASDFLTFRNGKWGGCGFDWIMNQKNFTKIREGNYDNQTEAQTIQGKMQSQTVQNFLNRRG